MTSTVDCPLCIDSSHVDIIEAALRIYPGRALINSISLEKEKFEKLLPIAKKYGAMFILLPLSDEGLPKDSAEKHGIIRTIMDEAVGIGMAKEDIIVDGLVATIGANPNAALECFETFSYCKMNWNCRQHVDFLIFHSDCRNVLMSIRLFLQWRSQMVLRWRLQIRHRNF